MNLRSLEEWESDENPVWLPELAALAYQLPNDSRTVRALAPEAANDMRTLLLREIEYNQRRWHWANTKAAEHGENEPQPIQLPGEREHRERDLQAEVRNAESVARRLGIEL